MDLEEYAVTRFAQAITSWPPDLVRDIYALSLYRDDNTVPYRPAVYLAYNTQSHLREMEESHVPTEAKWNLALWPHGAWIGLEDKHAPDDEGTRLVDAWLRMRADEGYTDADTLIPLFAALCVRIAQRLHRDGIITGTFGHAIPIIMHDDEWDEDIRTNTCAANLPGVAREFLDLEVI